MDWQSLANGQLLASAETALFDLFIICDQSMAYQQNMAGRSIAIVVLPTNNWTILRHNSAVIAAAVERVTRGAYVALRL